MSKGRVHVVAGSRWSNKRVLDEDRPLGRGMRIKQEPAHIQDPSMLTGTPYCSRGPITLVQRERDCQLKGDHANPKGYNQGQSERVLPVHGSGQPRTG